MRERDRIRQRRIDRHQAVTKLLIPLLQELNQVAQGKRYPDISASDVQSLSAICHKGDILKELQRVTSPTHRPTKYDSGLIPLAMDISLTMLRLYFPQNDQAIDRGREQGAWEVVSLLNPDIPSNLTYGMAKLVADHQGFQLETEELRRGQMTVHRLHVPTQLENVELTFWYEGQTPHFNELPRININVKPIRQEKAPQDR